MREIEKRTGENVKEKPYVIARDLSIMLYKDASANGFINEVKPYWIVPFSYIDEERLILTAMKVTSKTLTLSGIQTQLEELIESGQATMSEHSRADKRSLDRFADGTFKLLRENLELKIMLKAAREDVKKVQSALSRGVLGAN